MNATSLSSAGEGTAIQNLPRMDHRPLPAPGKAHGILAENWPTLARALSRYEQSTAERFSQSAYDCVAGGIIRLDERKRLAAEAETAGIRAFDAQLLIACAIRQWAMDHQYDSAPSPDAPALSFEYRAWRKVWLRIGVVLGAAVALDTIIIWKWLS
jgi:hypothetical protein